MNMFILVNMFWFPTQKTKKTSLDKVSGGMELWWASFCAGERHLLLGSKKPFIESVVHSSLDEGGLGVREASRVKDLLRKGDHELRGFGSSVRNCG